MKGFNKNDFIIDKVFDKLSKIKKKVKNDESHIFSLKKQEIEKEEKRVAEYKKNLGSNFDKECANDLVGSTEVHGPIKIDIVM